MDDVEVMEELKKIIYMILRHLLCFLLIFISDYQVLRQTFGEEIKNDESSYFSCKNKSYKRFNEEISAIDLITFELSFGLKNLVSSVP